MFLEQKIVSWDVWWLFKSVPQPVPSSPSSVYFHGSLRRSFRHGRNAAVHSGDRTSASTLSAPRCSCVSSALLSCRHHSSASHKSTQTTAPPEHSPSSQKSFRTWPTSPSMFSELTRKCNRTRVLKCFGCITLPVKAMKE